MLSNQELQDEFPATKELAFFNTGSFGPHGFTAMSAYSKALTEDLSVGRLAPWHDKRYFADMASLRSKLAKLLSCNVEQMALMPSTTEGINLALASIDWKAGDEILTSRWEHPGALNPIHAVAKRFQLNIVMTDIGGTETSRDLEILNSHLSSRTRAVVLSHVSWSSGSVLDLPAVGQLMQKYTNIDFIVDGAQSVGAMPISLADTRADFYCFPGQKWLCGPAATGGMFVSKRILETRRPSIVSYIYDAQKATAEMFEIPGVSWNRPALLSLAAQLEWNETKVGWANIFGKIQSLNGHLYKRLQDLSQVKIHSPATNRAGLLHFNHQKYSGPELTIKLMDQKIYLRDIPIFGFNRVATGFYNSTEDVDRLVQALENL